MKKFVCSVCGYVFEGTEAPDFCPQCKAPKEKFVEQAGEKTWAAEHVVGVAKDVPEDILKDLREEPQMYLLWDNYISENRYIGNLEFHVVLDTLEEVAEALNF